MSRRAFPPLPTNADWAPSWLIARGTANFDFAFSLEDPQGMKGIDGNRYHGAADIFAPGGVAVAAPGPGRIVHVTPSRGNTGQVFGGVVTIEQDTGICWVMRHVDPRCLLGAEVAAGDTVALVTDWRDGGDHLHLEIWKSLAGGYRWENCLDPADIEWTVDARETAEPLACFYFEELPALQGGTGPDIVGTYEHLSYAENARSLRATRGERVSTLAADDGRFYVLRWAEGTHGSKFRFGPWEKSGHRKSVLDQRVANTGRTMRAFNKRNLSLFPWPLES